MKMSSRRIAWSVAAVCALSLGAWAYLFHARSEWALADYKQQLRASGERLSVDELMPRPIDLESNGARIFQQALSYFPVAPSLLETNPPEAMVMVAPGKAMVGWRQPDLREQGTNTWEQAEAELEREVQALALLEQIVDRPALDFHLDYHQGFTLLLPYLAKLKQAALRLKAAALCDLRQGDSAKATVRIRAILALARGMQDERLVISQLVRIAIAHIALGANWELLQSPNVTDEELTALQVDWLASDYVKGAENALLMERAVGEQMAQDMKESSGVYRNLVGTGSGSSGDWLGDAGRAAMEKGKETMWRYAWASADQLRGLKGKQVLLDALRKREAGEDFKTMFEYQERKLSELGIDDRGRDDSLLFSGEDPRFMFTDSVRGLERLAHRLLSAEAARQLVVTAMELKRYQLKHGSYPSDLSVLQPDYLAAAPRDPVDEQLLRYKLEADGHFTLYSIGEDGKDDGGNPTTTTNAPLAHPEMRSFSWLKGQDLVWPMPATDAEVTAHREKARGRR